MAREGRGEWGIGHPPSLHPCRPYQGCFFQAPHNPPAPLAVGCGSSTLILPMEVAFVIESFPGGETEAHRGPRGMWAQGGATFSGRPGKCMLDPLVSVQGRGQPVVGPFRAGGALPPAPNQPPSPSPSPFDSASRCPPACPAQPVSRDSVSQLQQSPGSPAETSRWRGWGLTVPLSGAPCPRPSLPREGVSLLPSAGKRKRK